MEPLKHFLQYSKRNYNQHPIWSLSSNGSFTSKSCARILQEKTPQQYDFKWIWEFKCPNKIKYFLWQCLHNRLPCRQYFQHIGINIDNMCAMCHNKEESPRHIFLTCSIVQSLWAHLGIMIPPNSNEHWLLQLKNQSSNFCTAFIN